MKSSVLYARGFMLNDAPGKWEMVKHKDGSPVYESGSKHGAREQLNVWHRRLCNGKYTGKDVVQTSWGWAIENEV